MQALETQIKPYYESSGITLYLGDCREVLPRLGKEAVDLIICDPPYGVRWVSNNRTIAFAEMQGDHSEEAALAATSLALGCLKEARHVYLFGRYDLSSLRLTDPVELIWDKTMNGLGDLSIPWATSHEYIQFYVHRKSKANLDAGDGRLSARLRRGSILSYPRPNSGAVRHPSEKPVELLCELIESSSCRGETVLDYFAGTGATLEAARIEGRKAIGIEIEERYCEIAANRLRQEVLQF